MLTHSLSLSLSLSLSHSINTVFGQLKLLITHSQQLHRRLCAVVPEGEGVGRGGEGGAGLEVESSDALFVRQKFSKSTL